MIRRRCINQRLFHAIGRSVKALNSTEVVYIIAGLLPNGQWTLSLLLLVLVHLFKSLRLTVVLLCEDASVALVLLGVQILSRGENIQLF